MDWTLLSVQSVTLALAVLAITTSWPIGSIAGPVALVAFFVLLGVSITLTVRFGGLFWSNGTPQLIVIGRHIARSKSVGDLIQLIVFVASFCGLIWVIASGWANARVTFERGRHVLHGLGSPIPLLGSQLQLVIFTAHVLPFTLASLGLCAFGIIEIHGAKSLTKREFEAISRAFETGAGNTGGSPGPMLIQDDKG